MNFLLDVVHRDLSRNTDNVLETFRELPLGMSKINLSESLEVINIPRTLQVINQIGCFSNNEQLYTVLYDRQTSEKNALIFWITANLSSRLRPAKQEYKMPDFAPSILQFLYTMPPRRLTNQFMRRYREKGTSVLLFHGTTISALRSILLNGLIACDWDDAYGGYGIFMAEDPWYATRYAGFRDLYPSSQVSDRSRPWTNSPFKDYGILLGCEVAGRGRVVKHEDTLGVVHVILNVKSVIVRYVFLVPPHSMTLREVNFRGLVPPRSLIEAPMMQVMAQMRGE